VLSLVVNPLGKEGGVVVAVTVADDDDDVDEEVPKCGERLGDGGSEDVAGNGDAGVIGGPAEAGEIEERRLFVGLRLCVEGEK
jgi:hypothetical protein